VLWGAAVLAGWLIGGPLALFGLGGVALVLALAFIGLAAVGWRAAGIPLSLMAAALALSATVVASAPARLDRSVGLLWAQPRTADELVKRSPYVRGHGSVLLDLRRTNLPRGSVTDVRVESGDGRIFVALPFRRCVAVDVAYAQVNFADGVGDLALVGADGLGLVDRYGAWGGSRPFVRPGAPATNADWTNLEAYGRPVTTVAPLNPYTRPPSRRWSRPVDQSRAPLVRLHLAAAQQIFLRDYPDGAGPAFLATDERQPEAYDTGEQLADATWPSRLQLPRSPAEMGIADAWRERIRGAAAAAQTRRWRAWARRWVQSAARNANLAAGTCAPPEVRATYWNTADVRDPRSTMIHTLAVNALGEVRVYRSLGEQDADPTSLRIAPNPPAAFANLSVDRTRLGVG
jgi:hypothetical protein